MAVGILSAVGRIWGKAMQTDAAVSPNNYGGPLVDIRGRVHGRARAPVAAVGRGNRRRRMVRFGHRFRRARWRTSTKCFPKLRKGEDLYAGRGRRLHAIRRTSTPATP